MLVNFVSVVLLLASAIQALYIIAPATGSQMISGQYNNVNIGSAGEPSVAYAVVRFDGPNGAFAQVVIQAANFGQNIPFYLSSSFNSGLTVVTVNGFTSLGFLSGAPVSNYVTVVPGYIPNPYNPCYNPCIDPCFKPRDPCYRPVDPCFKPRDPCYPPRDSCFIPRDPCYKPNESCYITCPKPACPKPVCKKPVCNIPRPRDQCRIREESSSEQYRPRDQCRIREESSVDGQSEYIEFSEDLSLDSADAHLFEFNQEEQYLFDLNQREIEEEMQK